MTLHDHIETFCKDFFEGNFDLPAVYREMLLKIDIEFTRENIAFVFNQICSQVLTDDFTPGHVISVLAFANILQQRYSWCSKMLMISVTTNILEKSQLCSDMINLCRNYLSNKYKIN